MSRLPEVAQRWSLPVVLVVLYGISGWLNGRELLLGVRPSVAGLIGSALYVMAWLAHAVQSGLRSESGSLRRMAVIWAVIIAGTWLCSSFVPLNLGTGSATPGAWVVSVMLLVLGAPFYGLVGILPGDPLVDLVAVTVGVAMLTIACALAARTRSGRAATPRIDSAAGELAVGGAMRSGSLDT